MRKNSPVRIQGKSLLKALYEYGPMTTRTMQTVLAPSSARSIHYIVSRLHGLGLVRYRHGALKGRNVGNYYQLSLQEHSRKYISKLINVSADELAEFTIRSQELEHWQSCVLWTKRLQQLFPQAIIIRDIHMPRSQEALKCLLADPTDFDVWPDLLILYPKKGTDDFISVAVEVERSSKSKVRLYQKLKKLSSETLLDGVLYLCAKTTIIESLRNVYKLEVLLQDLRIKRYGSNFLMFSDEDQWATQHAPKMYNSEGKSVPLSNWVQYLSTKQLSARRDGDVF